MKNRIWELDAFRGVCILGMVIVHLLYDLNSAYHIPALQSSRLYRFALDWGAVLFILLSGICATLGRHPIRRGLTVFTGGLICSFATWLLYRLGLAHKSLIIYFGILHCLGICMLIWPLFKKLPGWLLLLLGAILCIPNAAAGAWWTMPLGFPPTDFASSDYFPLLPNLGYFLTGSGLGKYLYSRKTTLFPNVNTRNPLIAALCFTGRHALLVYLLHQPVITALLLIF